MADLSLTGISFPAQTELPAHSFLASGKRTRDWIKQLAGSPLARIAHEYYKALRSLNRSDISLDLRLALSQLFTEPVLNNSRRLEKYFLNLSFPLSEHDRKLAQLDLALLLELALSLKILLRDQLAKRPSQKDLALILQQILQLQLACLRQVALTYHSYPKNFWGETHQIYSLARRAGLALKGLPNLLGEQPRQIQAENLYKQILLLGLSDHYRLRQPDMVLILNQLPDWANAAQLLEQAQESSPDGLFTLDLQRNTPPLHLSLMPAPLHTHPTDPAPLLLDTNPLLQQIYRLRSQAQWNNISGQHEHQGLSIKTLDHFGLVWKTVPPRSSSRTNLRFELALAVGLKQIYGLLRKAQLEASPVVLGALADISQRSSGSEHDANELHNLGPGFGSITIGEWDHIDEQIFLEHDTSAPAWTWQDEQELSLQNYAIVNQSSGGYCIRWNTQNAPAIKVGELLGIRNDENPRLFSIGISRWMKYENEYSLLGIALLTQSSQPMQARLAHSDHSLLHPCILLGELEQDDATCLAAPPLAFREGQEIILFNPNLQIQARLLSLIEATAAFNLFSYEELSLQEGSQEGAANQSATQAVTQAVTQAGVQAEPASSASAQVGP
jgi:hypothetical protein